MSEPLKTIVVAETVVAVIPLTTLILVADKFPWIFVDWLTFNPPTTVKSFPIVATAPFYVKTSFHIFFAALLIGILVLFWINFVQSLNIRAATKAKIAMDLHDESGTILTRLLLISKKAKFEDKEKEQVIVMNLQVGGRMQLTDPSLI